MRLREKNNDYNLDQKISMDLYKEVFIYSDIPTTCPSCLRRSEIIANLSHTNTKTEIHKCTYSDCEFGEFIMQYDEDFGC